MLERLQKIISEHGLMSRRNAEKMISDGKVFVNGVKACLGDKADSETDIITIDGAVLKSLDKRVYIMLNKPKGYVTTMSDEKGRKNVTDLVKDLGIRVYPVGRLDLNSEGLLLLTNDGDFANHVMHPSNEKVKTYRVTVIGSESNVEKLSLPMEIDGYQIKPAIVKLLNANNSKLNIEIKIHEGRNRQVRKMCALCDFKVINLKRIAIGNVRLGDLRSGMWRELSTAEIQELMG